MFLEDEGSPIVTEIDDGVSGSGLRREAGDVLGWVAAGALQVPIGGVYPLAEAARAHRDLESRQTTGKLLLTVG